MFLWAGITRLDDQIFLNRNPGVPSVVKFHPFTPCVAVADKDSIWYAWGWAGLAFQRAGSEPRWWEQHLFLPCLPGLQTLWAAAGGQASECGEKGPYAPLLVTPTQCYWRPARVPARLRTGPWWKLLVLRQGCSHRLMQPRVTRVYAGQFHYHLCRSKCVNTRHKHCPYVMEKMLATWWGE